MKPYWIVTGGPKLAAVKYFWDNLRCKHRNAKYALGFYSGFKGLPLGSKNLDYAQGYKNAVAVMQTQAEENAMLLEQLRRSTARIEAMHERLEMSRRAVAENL